MHAAAGACVCTTCLLPLTSCSHPVWAALRRAAASVRVSAFAAMSRLVGRMDRGEAEAMLQTAVKVSRSLLLWLAVSPPLTRPPRVHSPST
jgi:hypothetical protein